MSFDSQFSSRYFSPSIWYVPSAQDRHAIQVNSSTNQNHNSDFNLGQYLKVDPELGIISYIGPGTTHEHAACIRTTEPIPADCPVYYFEVEVLDAGNPGHIGIGIQQAGVSMNRLPGWEQQSYGYHGDDGDTFHGSGTGKAYAHPYGTGDVIGVCVDRVQMRLCYYKNGLCCGVAFENLPSQDLYPCVGFRSCEAQIHVNLGREPFRYGLTVPTLRQDVSDAVVKQIACTVIPVAPKHVASPSALAVLDHLIHTSCWKTAQVVAKDILGVTEGLGPGGAFLTDDDINCMCERQKLRQLILKGDASQAKALLEKTYPGSRHTNPDVTFALDLQCFVELLRVAECKEADQEAIAFASSELQLDKLSDPQKLSVQDALTLLCYPDKMQAPSAGLFCQRKREQVAHEVNGAIMQQRGKSLYSGLEGLYRQLGTVHGLLIENNVMSARLISMYDVKHRGLSPQSEVERTPSGVGPPRLDDSWDGMMLGQ